MTSKIISISIFVALLFMAMITHAQIFNDWEARPSFTVEYGFTKKLSVGGTYYGYLDKNFTRYDKSVLAGEVGYKINSWLKAGFEYRYGFDSPADNHDLRYLLTFSHSFPNGLKIKFRPSLLHEPGTLSKKQQKELPDEYYLRNRLTVGYKIRKKMEVFAFTENYQEMSDGLSFYRQKSAIGASVGISKISALEIRFNVINKKKGKMNARVDVNYAISLGK